MSTFFCSLAALIRWSGCGRCLVDTLPPGTLPLLAELADNGRCLLPPPPPPAMSDGVPVSATTPSSRRLCRSSDADRLCCTLSSSAGELRLMPRVGEESESSVAAREALASSICICAFCSLNRSIWRCRASL